MASAKSDLATDAQSLLPHGSKPGDLPWLRPQMPDQWKSIDSAPEDVILEGTDGWVASLFVFEMIEGKRSLFFVEPRIGSYARTAAKTDWFPKLWRKPKHISPDYLP